MTIGRKARSGSVTPGAIGSLGISSLSRLLRKSIPSIHASIANSGASSSQDAVAVILRVNAPSGPSNSVLVPMSLDILYRVTLEEVHWEAKAYGQLIRTLSLSTELLIIVVLVATAMRMGEKVLLVQQVLEPVAHFQATIIVQHPLVEAVRR